MKKLLVILLSTAMIVAATVAMAVPIADLTGTRTIGNGLVGNDGNKGTDGWASKGFTFSWNITQSNGLYHYTYTLDPTGQGGVSGFILEVSPTITLGNISNLIIPTTASSFSGDSPKLWSQDGNINLPVSIYGIKFTGTTGNNDPAVFSFDSIRAPIWGDFFSKDGNFGYAYNAGIGQDPTTGPFTNWIATPDTISAPVPEPGTMVLLGSGLLGLAIFGKRRMNK